MKILIDINLFPEEYKDQGKVTKDMIIKYEKDFKVEVIPFDSKPNNTGGIVLIEPKIIN